MNNEQKAYIIENYDKLFTEDIAKNLGLTNKQVYGIAGRLGLKKPKSLTIENYRVKVQHPNSVTHRFQKGHVPNNKGKKQAEFMTAEQIENSKKTRFKKGRVPHGHKPIGYERISKDGYIERKVRDGSPKSKDNFELAHRLVWQEHNGEIPQGFIVIFKDGNKTNINIDNLELVSREQHMVNNSIHQYPQELQQLLRTTSKINKLLKKQDYETENTSNN